MTREDLEREINSVIRDDLPASLKVDDIMKLVDNYMVGIQVSMNMIPTSRFSIHSDNNCKYPVCPYCGSSIDDCPNHGISCDELVESSFIKGAEWQSKQSPWISVKDELPKDHFKQKIILLKDGQIRSAILDYYDENDYKTVYFWYDREADASFDLEDVIAWMKIPSFDGILGTGKQE